MTFWPAFAKKFGLGEEIFLKIGSLWCFKRARKIKKLVDQKKIVEICF